MPENTDSTNRKMLHANIEWHIKLVSAQVGHANKVKGRARSGYYKTVIILTATIVEAVLHALLVKKLGANGTIVTGDYEYNNAHLLPDKFNNGTDELVIARRHQKVLKMAKNPDFSAMNIACFKENIVNKRLHKKVDRVRKIRNRIHIQGL